MTLLCVKQTNSIVAKNVNSTRTHIHSILSIDQRNWGYGNSYFVFSRKTAKRNKNEAHTKWDHRMQLRVLCFVCRAMLCYAMRNRGRRRTYVDRYQRYEIGMQEHREIDWWRWWWWCWRRNEKKKHKKTQRHAHTQIYIWHAMCTTSADDK